MLILPLHLHGTQPAVLVAMQVIHIQAPVIGKQTPPVSLLGVAESLRVNFV